MTIGQHRLAVEYEKLVAAERVGVTTLPEYTDGQFVPVDVRQLLDGVDLASARDLRGSAARVFVSYSHRDEQHREHLDALKVPRMSGLGHEWHHRRIEPGDHSCGEIARELHRADVMACLVTPDFLPPSTAWTSSCATRCGATPAAAAASSR